MYWELYLLFFAIALLYAAVGFGGGSSYLAVLTLFGLDFLLIRSTSLLCNLVVVSGGVYIFYKNAYLHFRKTFPLVVSSVPFAFLGGRFPFQKDSFFILLGGTLLLAGALMWFQPQIKAVNKKQQPKKHTRLWQNIGLGSSIGFLAGSVGIGGGIFLAPVLHLLRWDVPKVIAATASFFILVNSAAGLAGQLSQPAFDLDWQFVFPLLLAVFLGGQIGSRLGADYIKPTVIKKMTAVLVLFVSLRILIKYLS